MSKLRGKKKILEIFISYLGNFKPWRLPAVKRIKSKFDLITSNHLIRFFLRKVTLKTKNVYATFVHDFHLTMKLSSFSKLLVIIQYCKYNWEIKQIFHILFEFLIRLTFSLLIKANGTFKDITMSYFLLKSVKWIQYWS